VQLQEDFRDKDVRVAGVTWFPAAEAELFATTQALDYPVLAEAQAVFDAWGVEAVWGSVVYLIDADGRVVARGIDRIRAALAR